MPWAYPDTDVPSRISDKHPLNAKSKPSVSDFASERFILFKGNDQHPLRNITFDVCESGGFFPEDMCDVEGLDALLLLVRSNVGVAVTAFGPDYICPDGGLCFIDSGTVSNVGVAWRLGNSNPMIQLFLNELVR